MLNPLFRKRAAASLGTGRLTTLCALLWEDLEGGGKDEATYTESEHKLAKLASGIFSALPPGDRRLRRSVENAKWDIRNAGRAAHEGDYGTATSWQFYAVQKLRNVLRSPEGRKLAYGYDISGELGEMFHGSEDIANRENQKNIDDTSQPFEQHETKPAPLNLTRDYEAEKDFPSLRDFKNKRINWPPRTR